LVSSVDIARQVELETLHHAIDYAILGRRIRAKPVLKATKERKQLSNNDVNYSAFVIPNVSQSRALDDDIVLAGNLGGHEAPNDHLHQTKIFVVDFTQQIAFIGPKCWIGG
jgi:hypothetical protein